MLLVLLVLLVLVPPPSSFESVQSLPLPRLHLSSSPWRAGWW
jgi:hypothetical protein